MIRRTMKTAGLLLLAVSFGYSGLRAAASSAAEQKAARLAALRAAAGKPTTPASSRPSTSQSPRQAPPKKDRRKPAPGKTVSVSKYAPNPVFALILTELATKITGDDVNAQWFQHCAAEMARVIRKGGWGEHIFTVDDGAILRAKKVTDQRERNRLSVMPRQSLSTAELEFLGGDDFTIDTEAVENAAATGQEVNMDDIVWGDFQSVVPEQGQELIRFSGAFDRPASVRAPSVRDPFGASVSGGPRVMGAAQTRPAAPSIQFPETPDLTSQGDDDFDF